MFCLLQPFLHLFLFQLPFSLDSGFWVLDCHGPSVRSTGHQLDEPLSGKRSIWARLEKGSKDKEDWMIDVLRSSLVVCCLLFVVCCLLFVVCCLLFVVWCLVFGVCCLLFVVCCLLLVAC